MLLLLARHGNTFNKGDKVVWVGPHRSAAHRERPRAGAGAAQDVLFAPRIKRVISGPLLAPVSTRGF